MVKLLAGAGAVVFGGMFVMDVVQEVVSMALPLGIGAVAGAVGATAFHARD